ncbi:MAG: S8 family serine peptidase [Crocinitomicaceae bacterium]|nr:S8 family serine peptidase [Crocinitomicaceae bacterium]
MKCILTIIIALALLSTCAQEKYWVYFSDKKGVTFDPKEYFHPNAIERRIKNNYPINHFSDRPLVKSYVQEVSGLASLCKGVSRWLNAIVVTANDAQIKQIRELPFVLKIEASSYHSVVCTSEEINVTHNDFEKRDLIRFQLDRMNAHQFKEHGITGRGLTIAIFDAGFPGVDKAPMFEHIRARDGIIGTYDFIRNIDNVYRKIEHGSMVFSCIAGVTKDSLRLGVATGANFLLAITEKLMKEGLAEEEAWLFAAEWADKNGADIINSSLGYTRRNHFKQDMDGQTAIITRAANLASAKGILVVSSAGNEGNKRHWMMVAAPADGDSVLAVGAINPWSGFHTNFSSFGPSSDKELKPNVTAVGHVIAYHKLLKMSETQGTSFSAPLVAGFAACAWQANPTLTNWELLKRIETSGDLYPYFDYAHGYGVPQADCFLSNTASKSNDSAFIVDIGDSVVTISIRDDLLINDTLFHVSENHDGVINIITKRDDGIKIDKNHPFIKHELFYYHLENKEGFLDEFSVLSVEKNPIVKIGLDSLEDRILRIHYYGFTRSIQF